MCEETQDFHELNSKKGKKQSAKSHPRPNFDITLDMESLMQDEDDEAELDHHPDDDNWNEMCDDFAGFEDDEEEPEPVPVPNPSLDAASCVMFASRVTLDGLRVTIRSLIELVDFLLPKFPYVLTEKFSQDVLEVGFIIGSSLICQINNRIDSLCRDSSVIYELPAELMRNQEQVPFFSSTAC